jgi:hypothetical protein
MSQEALDLLLSGVKDPGQRKQITSAYYAFANGDPETFAVQFAVLLRAHALSLKALPERLQKALGTETNKLSDLIAAHQTAMGKVVSLVNGANKQNGLGERLEAMERRIEERLAAHSEALKAEQTILTTIAGTNLRLNELAAHRIVLGLLVSYTLGVLSALAVQHLLPLLPELVRSGGG